VCYFFKGQGEKPASPTTGRAGAGIAVATVSIFNAEIWKKSRISLSSLSSQSTKPKNEIKFAVIYLFSFNDLLVLDLLFSLGINITNNAGCKHSSIILSLRKSLPLSIYPTTYKIYILIYLI